jgi:IS30 family transposase
MVTLVERPSRFAVLIKVPSKNTAVVVAALSGHVRKLPATLRRSLTWGRRLEEMARHKTFTVATDVKVYSAIRNVPGSAASRNTNLLLRQYSFEERTCPSTRKRNSIEFRCA